MNRSRWYAWVQRAWYERAPGFQLLLPLSWLYRLAVAIRRGCYRLGIFRQRVLPAPVIVIGNLVAGGAGKTPVTLFLAQALKEKGLKPGIVSRGYGREDDTLLVEVAAGDAADEVGDEPLLLARRSGCPVVVGRDRVTAARRLLQRGVDVILADDGLQHYRLARDFELCVVDAERGFGNGCLLPAGPLREPLSRLLTVDSILLNGAAGKDNDRDHASLARLRQRGIRFSLTAENAERLDGSARRPLTEFAGRTVHAIAGIGNPERFFRLLRSFGVRCVEHPLADHARIDEFELERMTRTATDSAGAHDILMTEKDAVRLGDTSSERLWAVPVDLVMEPSTAAALIREVVASCERKQESSA
ncbi:MAG: tetraacyldisaccharide 4'-kinase [Pseudomonadota bacterium]